MPPQDMGLQGGYGAAAFSDAFTQMLAEQAAQRLRQQQLQLQQQKQVAEERRATAEETRTQQDFEARTIEAKRKQAADDAKTAGADKADREFADALDSSDFTPQQKSIIKLARKSATGAVPWEVLAPKAPAPGSTFDQLFATQKALIAKQKGVPVEQLELPDVAAAQAAAVKAAQPPVDPALEKNRGLEGQVLEQTIANNPGAAAAEARRNAALETSYKYSDTQLANLRKPIADRAERFSRLQSTIDQATPQADALLAPEIMTIMAGGQGSGMRINEAEIQRVVGGRSAWESIKAAINHWNADPSKALSVTPAQRQQIRALVSLVGQRTQSQLDVIDNAGQALVDAGDTTIHKQTLADTRKQLDDIMRATGAAAGVPAALPTKESRVAGVTRATINGVPMIWQGQGWAPEKH